MPVCCIDNRIREKIWSLLDILGGVYWLEIEVEKQTRKGCPNRFSRRAYNVNFTGKGQRCVGKKHDEMKAVAGKLGRCLKCFVRRARVSLTLSRTPDVKT